MKTEQTPKIQTAPTGAAIRASLDEPTLWGEDIDPRLLSLRERRS